MNKYYRLDVVLLVSVLLLFKWGKVAAQYNTIHWAADGYQYFVVDNGNIVEQDTRDTSKHLVLIAKNWLAVKGINNEGVKRFEFSGDGKKVLINTNTQKVWRYDTRGDYWLYDIATKVLKQVGKSRPASLMFAKLSPDGSKVAYVSGHNIFVETLATGAVKQLTANGTEKLINGTFDWAYEEEFNCRDGFRWSPDGKAIAYWQIDASKIRKYVMLNTTDSIYPYVVPVEYPVAGQDPSRCRIGVLGIETGVTKWLNVPGDAVQHYIPRMEWANNNEVILEQLNRAQNESVIYLCNYKTASAKAMRSEQDKAWIDIKSMWNGGDSFASDPAGWDWIEPGKSFVWASEKDGWRHLYKVGFDGKESLITQGNYDVISIDLIDAVSGYVYFTASPDSPLQRYLFRVKISGGSPERLTPADEPGTHEYKLSPNGKIAIHGFSNSYTSPKVENITLPDHQYLSGDVIRVNALNKSAGIPEFFRVKTVDGVDIDGWIVKPTNFDPSKKYPVVFYTYGEPASQVVTDTYGVADNDLYKGKMADDGYIYIGLDNRGAPAPRGREWRKSIYKSIGTLNSRDQAMAAKEVLKWKFTDTSRVAVWGWSGGGSTTLNLMFQYPEIYKTGIAIAAEGWFLSYDNIYQERYMGVPLTDADRAIYIKGSPVSYAKNLRGNLLYIHGTGDDNVHYQNAELLINELVKNNRQFQLMLYPNRTHSISEGVGTREHLATLFTNYLKEHCPPGAR